MATKIKSPHLISVVMCAYNVRSYIEQAVNSILEQTYPNLELIISDDGSTDGTREYLEQLKNHPKVRLFLQPNNIGYVANKNFAISQAKGDYITQNDSDDLSDPSRLEKQMAICTENPAYKIIACGYKHISFTGEVYKTVQPEADQVFTSYTGAPYPFWFPPLLVHREVYENIGFFTNQFAGMGDDFYWTVKANERYSIYCLNEALYFYRDNPKSITYYFNDDRKIIVPGLLQRLLKQRVETGTDYLEQEDFIGLERLEEEVRNDKRFMAEEYRIWAAKAINSNDWKQSIKLLKASFKYNNLNLKLYRTFSYYVRQRIKFRST